MNATPHEHPMDELRGFCDGLGSTPRELLAAAHPLGWRREGAESAELSRSLAEGALTHLSAQIFEPRRFTTPAGRLVNYQGRIVQFVVCQLW